VVRYEATEPDELMLEESDVINVHRKVVSDGKSMLDDVFVPPVP